MKFLFALLFTLVFSPICAAQADLIWCSPFQNLYEIIDRTTGTPTVTGGTFTIPGGTVDGATSMAIDPTTGTIYVVLKLNAVTGRVLATFDRTNGNCTQVGNLGDNFSSITFSPTGTLFGVTGDGATVPETLYSINTSTGVPTMLATLGNGADGEVIAFNADDGLIYHSSGNGTVVLETINPTTFAITNIPVTFTGETFGMTYDREQGLFYRSSINSDIGTLTTTGTFTSTITGLPDDARGLVIFPRIDSSTTTLNLGTTTQGVSSTSVSFDISGHHQVADLVVTAPTDVRVSLMAASGFATTFNLTPTAAGTVATTTIFARIPASAPQGAISGNITLTTTAGDTINVAVSGQVDPPTAAPEMDVLRGATAITDGGTDARGNQQFGTTLAATYTIENNGAAILNLTGTPVVSVTAGTNTQNVSVVAQPAATVGISGSVTFTVNYEVIAAGPFDFSVSIDNNDPDEGPYDWTVSGTGTAGGGNDNGGDGGDDGGCSTGTDVSATAWLALLGAFALTLFAVRTRRNA